MRVEATKQAGSDQVEAGRALVVTSSAPVGATCTTYRQAAFLAHLIATKDQAPQTRQRRRAEPSEAIAAYRVVHAMTRA